MFIQATPKHPKHIRLFNSTQRAFISAATTTTRAVRTHDVAWLPEQAEQQ